jgi:hypothetical protein
MAGGRKRAKKRRAQKSKKGKGGGVMMGMRSGFKNVASSVTGAEPEGKKSSWVGTAITILLLVAAAALLFQRFR